MQARCQGRAASRRASRKLVAHRAIAIVGLTCLATCKIGATLAEAWCSKGPGHEQAGQGQQALSKLRRRQLVASTGLGVLSSGVVPKGELHAKEPEKMDSSSGTAAEDLVYLGWFVGKWRCTAEVKEAAIGAGGVAALQPAGVKAAWQASSAAVGTSGAVNQAACMWTPTSPAKNGLSRGFAVEEDGGVGIGILAAAQAVAGPKAAIKPEPGRAGDAVFLVAADSSAKSGSKSVWRLTAVGAFGQPERNEESFKVSELFEFEDSDSPRKPLGVIRVITTYQRGDAKQRLVRAVQRTSLLAAPATDGAEIGNKDLATITSFLELVPIASA